MFPTFISEKNAFFFKLHQKLVWKFQNVTQELDLISSIKIQRQLSEVTVTHRIGDISEQKNEQESAKKSEPETKKHIGDDKEMK